MLITNILQVNQPIERLQVSRPDQLAILVLVPLCIHDCPVSRVNHADVGLRADLAPMAIDEASHFLYELPRPSRRVVVIQVQRDVAQCEKSWCLLEEMLRDDV